MNVARFAPSPTGHLHAGHAYAALFAAAAADRFVLRIEDIDRGRCRPEFTACILEDLAWLGLRWEQPVRIQSDHMADYRACLDELRGRGLLYPCFCTRAETACILGAPHDPTGALVYPGTCRNLDQGIRAERLARGDSHAWRLDVGRALRMVPSSSSSYELEDGGAVTCRPERFGDVVLGRKDVDASYHLCATHDDALQGITLVTRAEDLAPVTDIHRLLQELMGWPAPRYRFHKLITGPDGRRLSKRDGVVSLRAMARSGMMVSDLRRELGFEPDR